VEGEVGATFKELCKDSNSLNINMNPEIVKFGSGLAALAIYSYTIISVSEKGNGMKFRSDGSFELGKKIDSGNKEILSEMRNLETKMRDLQSDVNKRFDDLSKRLDDLSNNVRLSSSKTSNELKYIRGLTTQTRIDVELMKKKRNYIVTYGERAKYMNELITAGKAGPDLSDDE
jgi:hypothetical protein